MPAKKAKTVATIIARWTRNGPVVKISNFENLSPVKIDKCFEAVNKEWHHQRAVSIGNRRKQEMEERAGAENG